MLAIRLQRTGRKGHAMFRIIVQDARRTPTSGNIVSLLGSYDPHAKTIAIDKEQAASYLSNGAQPTDRVIRLLKAEGVKLPKWVSQPDGKKTKSTKNPDKLRKNQPAEPTAEQATSPATEAPTEPSTEEAKA